MKPSAMCDIYFSIRSEESRVFAESDIYVLLSRGFFTSVIERVFFVSLPLAIYIKCLA